MRVQTQLWIHAYMSFDFHQIAHMHVEFQGHGLNTHMCALSFKGMGSPRVCCVCVEVNFLVLLSHVYYCMLLLMMLYYVNYSIFQFGNNLHKNWLSKLVVNSWWWVCQVRQGVIKFYFHDLTNTLYKFLYQFTHLQH